MSDIALRPRSATELVDAAFQLYRGDPLPFITGLALIYVPWVVIIAATGLTSLMSGDADPTALAFGPLFVVGIGSGFVYMLAASVTTMLASDAYFGRSPDLANAFRAVVRRFGDIFIASLLVGVSVMLGFVAFILPALYIYGRLFAAKQVILLENMGGSAAVGRSWRLAKGSVWHVMNTMGLAILLNLAVGLGGNFIARMIPSHIVQIVIASAVSCVIYPIVGIIETLLYYDIRIRREGFDIEFLAAVAPSAPAERPAPT